MWSPHLDLGVERSQPTRQHVPHDILGRAHRRVAVPRIPLVTGDKDRDEANVTAAHRHRRQRGPRTEHVQLMFGDVRNGRAGARHKAQRAGVIRLPQHRKRQHAAPARIMLVLAGAYAGRIAVAKRRILGIVRRGWDRRDDNKHERAQTNSDRTRDSHGSVVPRFAEANGKFTLSSTNDAHNGFPGPRSAMWRWGSRPGRGVIMGG
jgi:hypothetical protein